MREANTRPVYAPDASPLGDFTKKLQKKLLGKSFRGHREKRRERANSWPAVAAWARAKHTSARERDN